MIFYPLFADMLTQLTQWTPRYEDALTSKLPPQLQPLCLNTCQEVKRNYVMDFFALAYISFDSLTFPEALRVYFIWSRLILCLLPLAVCAPYVVTKGMRMSAHRRPIAHGRN